MELQQLTEQMLLAVTSLNRSCIPQSVQEPLKGENFLLDYLSAQNGCSTPGCGPASAVGCRLRETEQRNG